MSHNILFLPCCSCNTAGKQRVMTEVMGNIKTRLAKDEKERSTQSPRTQAARNVYVHPLSFPLLVRLHLWRSGCRVISFTKCTWGWACDTNDHILTTCQPPETQVTCGNVAGIHRECGGWVRIFLSSVCGYGGCPVSQNDVLRDSEKEVSVDLAGRHFFHRYCCRNTGVGQPIFVVQFFFVVWLST